MERVTERKGRTHDVDQEAQCAVAEGREEDRRVERAQGVEAGLRVGPGCAQ